jgi:thymidylate synthase
MLSLKYRNCNDAFPVTMMYLREKGVALSSRNGSVIEYPEPVSVMYSNPTERVLFSPERNINPFLHFFEPLWILAGQNDVAFMSNLVGQFSEYSDDGVTYAAAYGHRLRYPVDQLVEAIARLKKNPDDRRVVLQIRRPDDIYYTGKDAACNLAIALKIRNGKLNIHVFNRSNDAIWGGPAGGANYPQFTVIQEYIAGHIGCEIGSYHQTTDSMHVYVDNPQWSKLKDLPVSVYDPYEVGDVKAYPMMKEPDLFDSDLFDFFLRGKRSGFESVYFNEVVTPMWDSFTCWKEKANNGTHLASQIQASDWREAVHAWINRREAAKKK